MLSIQNQQQRLPHLGRSLRRRVAKLLDHLGLAHAEISLLLCDDPTIRSLNQEWRGIDKATDVLSFPQEEWMGLSDVLAAHANQEQMPCLLGDIVISVDTCICQAEEWKHTTLDEATRLWIHGFLHLCGHDHHEEEEAREMRLQGEKLLAMFRQRKIEPLTYTAVSEEST